MAESVAYRSIIVTSQYASWLFGQLLRVRYSIRAHRPAELFEYSSEHCLILAPNHKSYLDPWLLMIALNFLDRPSRVNAPGKAEVVLSTSGERGAGPLRSQFELGPDEGLVAVVEPSSV